MSVYIVFLDYILYFFFFFSSRRRHTRYWRDWSSDVCSSDLGVLVEGLPVEAGERELVLREVGGDPVHDHADAGLVQPVDEVAQVVRVAEARGGRVVAGDLVAPRAAERVLGEGKELDVRVVRLAQVVDQLVGGVAVAEAGPPGAEVQLVHAHRLVVRVDGGAALEPLLVVPLVRARGDDRGGGRRDLGVLGPRVGLLDPAARGGGGF